MSPSELPDAARSQIVEDEMRATSFGYNDRVFVPPSDPLRSEGTRGVVVGQGKNGKLRIRLDSGSTVERWPEDLRHDRKHPEAWPG